MKEVKEFKQLSAIVPLVILLMMIGDMINDYQKGKKIDFGMMSFLCMILLMKLTSDEFDPEEEQNQNPEEGKEEPQDPIADAMAKLGFLMKKNKNQSKDSDPDDLFDFFNKLGN